MPPSDLKDVDVATAAAFYVLGRMSVETPVRLAGRRLTEGTYKPAAADLSFLSMQPSYSMTDVGPLFEQILRELGISLPTLIDAKRTVVRHRLELMVAGPLAPFEGLSLLYGEVDLPNPAPGDPAGLDALHVQWHLYCEICFPELKEPAGRRARDAETIALAKRWLAEHVA